MESFDSFGERKAEIVYSNIHKKMKMVELSKLQHASSLFNKLGSKKLLIINQWLFDNNIAEPRLGQLVSIEGISETLASNYLDNINKFSTFVQTIENHISIQYPQKKVVIDGKMNDYNVVFTKVRDKSLEQYITDNGGKVGSGVSKKTTHLVVLVIGGGTSKEKKAIGLSIPIMTLPEFKQLINYSIL